MRKSLHNARSITAIIDRDLREHPDFHNSHDLDVAKCRLTPTAITCANSFGGNRPIELWLVLRETPNSRGGYLVVFDSECGTFGLAVDRDPLPVLIGRYGSFRRALAGM